MKIIILSILSIISSGAMANIPLGGYQIEKIQCAKSGKLFVLGGKMMIYKIHLKVTETEMIMTTNSKNNDRNLPEFISCTQVNSGSYTYTQENIYEGELKMTKVECNVALWTGILRWNKYGVEAYGAFHYKVTGNKLAIYNEKTLTKYSCDTPGDYPVLNYIKI